MHDQNGMIKSNSNTFAVFYRLVDFATIQLGLFAAIFFYGVTYNQQYLIVSLLATLTFFFIAESFSLYRSWRTGYFKQIIFYSFLSWGIASIVVLFFLFFSKSSIVFSRVTIAIWFTLTYLVLVGWRYAFARFLEKIRAKGHNTRSVAIIGLTKGASRLIQQILDNPEIGYRIKAIYDDRTLDRIDASYHHLLDGSIEEGVAKAKNNEFDAIYIALPMTAENRIKEILFKLGDTTANVQLVPDLFIYCLMNASMSHVGEIQTISVYNNPMQGANAVLKRIEDILLSLVILTIIAVAYTNLTLPTNRRV